MEVDDVEALEANDEDEGFLVTTFRCGCGRNMREASSVLIAAKPPWFELDGPSQPNLGSDGKDGGEATIVVIGV